MMLREISLYCCSKEIRHLLCRFRWRSISEALCMRACGRIHWRSVGKIRKIASDFVWFLRRLKSHLLMIWTVKCAFTRPTKTNPSLPRSVGWKRQQVWRQRWALVHEMSVGFGLLHMHYGMQFGQSACSVKLARDEDSFLVLSLITGYC